MFTGIVQAKGAVRLVERRGVGARVSIATGTLALRDAQIGDSIAVNGVCLTAVAIGNDYFDVDVSNETLTRTTLGMLIPGDSVNLEKALAFGDRLGGHWVSGHVDGVGRLRARAEQSGTAVMTFELLPELMRYIAVKGSVTVDGVSLTVNRVDDASFDVTLVPHTLSVTTLAQRRPGDSVNIEVDLIARYLERLGVKLESAASLANEFFERLGAATSRE